MEVSTLLAGLVGFMTVAMTIDKFLHTFGMQKLISTPIRHVFDGAVAKAATTPGTRDDEFAKAAQDVAHKIADAIDSGEDMNAMLIAKDFAAKRAATK